MISETNILIFSLIGGIIPALFWLWFWLREDRLRPEPKSALVSAFFGGIVAVILALFFELVIYFLLADATASVGNGGPAIFWQILNDFATKHNLIAWQTETWGQIQNWLNKVPSLSNYTLNAKKIFLVILIAPVVEEILKFLVTYTICLRRKVNNEPVDASIYLLTAALGFAALETALFLTEPLSKGNILDTIMASNFRSVGPMLIHLISSACIGIFMGLAFFKSRVKKIFYLISGLILAIVVHSIFNLLIVLNETTQNLTFFWGATFGTWVLMLGLLMMFKKVRPKIMVFLI